MKKFILQSTLLLLVSFMFFSGCKKDKNETTTTTTNPTTTSVTLSGTVIDVNNTPLQDVTVKIGTTQATTGTDGSFFISNVTVPLSRFVVEFSKIGYFSLVRSAVPEASEQYDLEVGLISETDPIYAGSTSFASNATGTLSMNGSVINFPANAFINSSGSSFNGTVYVKAAYLDPTMDNYSMFVFGGDLYGKDSTGTEVMLNPYTGLNVIISDGANKLQLDSIHNVKAQVKFNIPATLITSAPNTIELFDFNENAGMAYANGTATKTGGQYMGQVQHFSFWNCAEYHPGKALISGRVTDANGLPISGVYIRIGHTYAKTNADGYYHRKVQTGVNIVVGILPSYFGNILNNPQTLGPLADGGSATADFTITGLKKITGKTVNCSGSPIQAKVLLSWYSNITSLGNVHTSCFAKPDGTFTLFMENSVTYAQIHAWGNGTDAVTFIDTITNPYTVPNIILCPPIQTGPTTLVLLGGLFTTSTTLNSFNSSKEGYKVIDTITGNAHSGIYVYGNDGMYNISTNGFPTAVPTTYTIGTKSGTTKMYFNTYGTIQVYDSLLTGTIKITKVSAVGGLIEGNFSGTSSTGISVSGVFSVPRIPDYHGVAKIYKR